MKRVLSALPDARDFHVYGGLVLIGAGAWQLSPAWALVGVGAALAAIGMFWRGA